MKTLTSFRRPRLGVAISIAMVAGSLAASSGTAFAATPNTLDLKVLLVGDGAFQMTGTELSTAVRLGLTGAHEAQTMHLAAAPLLDRVLAALTGEPLADLVARPR